MMKRIKPFYMILVVVCVSLFFISKPSWSQEEARHVCFFNGTTPHFKIHSVTLTDDAAGYEKKKSVEVRTDHAIVFDLPTTVPKNATLQMTVSFYNENKGADDKFSVKVKPEIAVALNFPCDDQESYCYGTESIDRVPACFGK